MSGAFVDIDLAGLPPPSIVETLDFEGILAAMIADLRQRFPAFSAALESEPAVKVLEVAAYRELLIRQRFNDGARQMLLAFATGSNLDHLAALFAVQRLVVDPGDASAFPPRPHILEADGALRRRVQLALEGASTAGPRGAYLFHALGAHPQVVDASVRQLAPGTVGVAVMTAAADGTASAEVVAAVAAVLSGKTVRPLSDTVVVSSACPLATAIRATLFTSAGPDAELVRAAALAAVGAYIGDRARLGRAVSRSGLFAALHRPGVDRVTITSPAADVTPAWDQVVRVSSLTVTTSPTDD